MTGTDGYKCGWRYAPGVHDEVKALAPTGAAHLAQAMKRYGKGTALPRQVKALGDGLSELRVTVCGTEYRLIFFHPVGHIAVGLVAFQKDTRKTPGRYLTLAKDRKGSWQANGKV